MATRVSEIVDISDDDADAQISVVYATPAPVNKGATKSDVISVEDYRPLKLKSPIDGDYRPLKLKAPIDIDGDYRPPKLKASIDIDIDEVELLGSFPKSQKRNFFKGECSNSKKTRNTQSTLPATFICEICTDEKPKNEIFHIQGCAHSYCSDCIGKYVASKLQDNITAISCPFPGCAGLLEPHHCRPILPDQVFDRWGDALCEALILAKEKFYCPFKDCSALLLNDTDGVAIAEAECPNCNRLFCGQCKVPWHSGIECTEFQRLRTDERSREDIAMMNLAKDKRWARCPNCGIYVEKILGCDNMSCRCGCSFSYTLGTNYGHTLWGPTHGGNTLGPTGFQANGGNTLLQQTGFGRNIRLQQRRRRRG